MAVSKLAKNLSEKLYQAGQTHAGSIVLDTGCVSFAEWTQRCLDEAYEKERDRARHGVGEALIVTADNLLPDSKSDVINGHVSAVLREIGTMLKETSGAELVYAGLIAIVDEIRAEQAIK
jgi:hypothetical protein